MRVIVHTGKGGVGKTSISAATALRCADMGLKTIVISTDTAHSLADSLDKEIGPEPVELYPNLWAQEVDARYSMDKYWGRFQKYLVALFSRNGIDDIVAEEVTILPGLEEGAHLLWINQYWESKEFDVLIVDAAPTAETLRLLSLPDVTRWWLERVLSITRGAARILRPIGRVMSGGGESSIPDADAWDQIGHLFDTLDKVRDLLADPEVASLRLIVNPERMVIKETQRTYTYLNLYGYATDAIVCNRIIPDEVTDPYFAMWKDKQRENLGFIEEAFGGLPVLTSPLLGGEVGGLESLRQMANEVYGDRNPAERMFEGQTHQIEKDGTGYTLQVPLPFIDKDDMDLYRSRDEITLRVGPYRRNIVLPYTLWDLEIADAKFQDSTLCIRFDTV